MNVAVALVAEPEEVVVAGDDLPGRPGEVDLEDRHVAAEVVHVEDQFLGEFGGIAPDDPARAQRGQPELVPRGADRLDPGQPEVEDHVGCTERGEEAAAGPVHVNVHVEAGVGLQLVQGGGHVGHRLVRAGVGDTQGRHHHDRVLVDPFEHRRRIHHVAAGCHRDLAHLDVPVAGELVPHHLHRAAHHVRVVDRLARPPAAWPATATWPPSRPACTPPTSRWPRRPRCWPPRARSTGRPSCARTAARSPRSAGTRPGRSCSC